MKNHYKDFKFTTFQCIYEVISLLALGGMAFQILPLISYVFVWFVYLIIKWTSIPLVKSDKYPKIKQFFKKPVIQIPFLQVLGISILKVVAVTVIFKIPVLHALLIIFLLLVVTILGGIIAGYLKKN